MNRNTIIGVAIILCGWSIAQAQQDQKFAQALKQNAQALRQYTWKSRTEVRKEGDVKSTKLFMSRYAADGTQVQILLEEDSAKLPKFGLRGSCPVARRRSDHVAIENSVFSERPFVSFVR